MPSIFESKSLIRVSKPLRESAKRIEILFPDLEWDLKKAGYADLDASTYLSMVIYSGLVIFITLFLATVVIPYVLSQETTNLYIYILLSLVCTFVIVLYLFMIPRVDINRRSRLIDNSLEYMLKDIQIQLKSGVPLFDTIVNVSRWQYGECSRLADGIIKEVEAGRSITDVLDNVGMLSPSDYLRKVLWQIVNAVRSGSDVVKALDYISHDIRQDKEAKIKMYSRELNLWSLIYMMGVIIAPSMGVTLLVVLSSFIGGAVINENTLWAVLLVVSLMQVFFITFLKEKRPQVT